MVADRNRHIDIDTAAVLQRQGERAAGPGTEIRLADKTDAGFDDESAPADSGLEGVRRRAADRDRIGAVLSAADVRGTDLQDVPRGAHPVGRLDQVSPSRIEVRVIRIDAEFMNGVAPLAPAHAERKAGRLTRHHPALGYVYHD